MVKVNENCIGCGACNAVCPDVFDFNDEGKAYANVEDIKEEDIEMVKSAIEYCPTDAIIEIKEENTSIEETL